MKQILLLVLIVLSLFAQTNSYKIGEIEHIDGYTPYKPEKQKLLKFLIDETAHLPETQSKFIELYKLLNVDPKQAQFKASCLQCKLALTAVNHMEKTKNKILEFLEHGAEYICNSSHLLDQSVCDGTVQGEGPYIGGALFDHYMAADFLCPLLHFCAPIYETIDIDNLIADILKDKPQNPEKIVPKGQNTFKFLHLADMHTEDKYDPKWDANCKYFDCCIPDSGLAPSENDQGGYWGYLGFCDIPTRTAQKMIEFIKNHVKDLDFALWTGDNTGHDVWEQSYESNISNTGTLTKLIRQILPDLPIIPIFGNHEPYPVNVYEWGKSDKFNKYFADLWEPWIGAEQAKNLHKKSFYELEIKNNSLKVIVLNTQASYNLNFDLIRNPTDPGHMLQFLRNSLLESEKKGQPVYIAAHIPAGSDFLNTYSRVYNAIIQRFAHIIMGQFTGHTHNDEFNLHYDNENPNKPVNMDWIAPSGTTYGFLNPSFRVFEADSETFQILNMFQYRLNLTYWNQFSDPSTELIWDLAYDMLSEYNLPNVWDYENLQNLRERIGNDLTTFNKYYINFFSGNKQPLDKISNKYYCHILPIPKEITKCRGELYIPFPTEVLAGPWIQKVKKSSTTQLE